MSTNTNHQQPEKYYSLVEEELKDFMGKRGEGLPSKWEMKKEIEEFGEICSDLELNKEFHEFKKSLLDREDFSPSTIEILDNSLTDKEIENYKAIICSLKYIEGITLKNGKRIYPDREVSFYKERALSAIKWIRCNESDFEDYNDILFCNISRLLQQSAWRDIAEMFFNEVTFELN